MISLLFSFILTFSLACAQERSPFVGKFIEVQEGADVEEIIERARNQLELPESTDRSFLANWLGKFNFKQVGLNAYRWASAHSQNPAIRGNVLNLAMILPASHFLEMSSGPVGVYYANQMDLGLAVTSAVGTIGALISVPGLDPLCAILLLTYKFKPVQNSWTLVRVGLFKTSVLVAKITGLQLLWETVFASANRIDALRNHFKGLPQVETSLEFFGGERRESFRFWSDTGSLILRLHDSAGQKPYLESVEVTGNFQMNKSLQPFGYNIRAALEQVLAIENIENLEKFSHISSVESVGDSKKIKFVPSSLPLHPKISLRCGNALKR